MVKNSDNDITVWLNNNLTEEKQEDFLTLEEVTRNSNVSEEAVKNWEGHNSIIYKEFENEQYYPSYQFDEQGRVLPFFQLANKYLIAKDYTPTDVVEWLESPLEELSGVIPASTLSTDPEKVITVLLNSPNKGELGANGEEVLVWVDVETTGFNPRDCQLLQVAAIVTDVRGNKLSEDFNVIVKHDDWEWLRDSSTDFVKKMHSETGLWEKLPNGIPVEEVDEIFYNFVTHLAPNKKQARLAGNSVRLDLNFLEEFLPKTYSHLHYRSVDVSALGYALDAWGVASNDFEKKKTHDALDDIRESLAEYCYFRDKVLNFEKDKEHE